MKPNITIERLFEGRPLISPTDRWWESGVTFNAAAVYLEPIERNLRALEALLGEKDFGNYPDGVVALHYRARPKEDPGRPWSRSYVGVSVHNPDLTPIKRFEAPVLEPGGTVHDADTQGVEDPRITWFEGRWWMVYCGVSLTGDSDPEKAWIGTVCIAWSDDLVVWTKVGPIMGDGENFAMASRLAETSNKDGVLLPDRINGKVVLLHRPMKGPIHSWGTSIAIADDPEGPYEDLGCVHAAASSEGCIHSWAGAGSVPIHIDGGVYLSIEHTGNYVTDRERKYVLDAFLYDFKNWDPARPETLISARFDDFMRPETDFEVYGPFPESVANVVFVCGSYVHDGWLYMAYGGGDSFILAARLRLDHLLGSLLDLRVPRSEPLALT
jgi:predicted GH43/DUF377 family glycosyl hydrolase